LIVPTPQRLTTRRSTATLLYKTFRRLLCRNLSIATIQEVSEGVPLNFTAIDSGTVTLSINEYIGDAWFVSDEARQDHRRLAALQAARAQESTRAIAEYQESKLLKALNDAQTDADANSINGVGHRHTSTGGGGNEVEFEDFARMKLAFDKARVPIGGRIAIVDPSVEYVLNNSSQVTTSDNPMFQGLITEGFAQNHRFVRNIFGWDVWVSDMLPKGTFDDGTNSVTNGVANTFLSVFSDQTTPIMYATLI